jgi:hypothetical protein
VESALSLFVDDAVITAKARPYALIFSETSSVKMTYRPSTLLLSGLRALRRTTLYVHTNFQTGIDSLGFR